MYFCKSEFKSEIFDVLIDRINKGKHYENRYFIL